MFVSLLIISSLAILATDKVLVNKLKSVGENIFSRFKSSTNIIKKRFPLYLEISRKYSWKNIVELFILRLRIIISRYLETGYLTRPNVNFYDLVYYDGTNRYVVRFPRLRGPSQISHILDGNDVDVTDKLKEYLGPSYNFHGISTSPIVFGYDLLTFVFIDGRMLTFKRNDTIHLPSR